MAAVTREAVFQAAAALVGRGESPTLQAVRREIGGGSYSTIGGYMQEWRARSDTTVAALVPATSDGIPQQLQRATSELWALALSVASQRLEVERNALAEARLAAQAQVNQVVAVADDAVIQVEQLRVELVGVRAELLELSAKLAASESRAVAAIEERDRLNALLSALLTDKRPPRTKQAKQAKAEVDQAQAL